MSNTPFESGQIYNTLKVLYPDEEYNKIDNKNKRWFVECIECGTIRSMQVGNIKKYKSGCICDRLPGSDSKYKILDNGISIIYLKNGEEALISTCDLDLVKQHLWYMAHGYPRTDLYADGIRSSIGMHQLILGRQPRGYMVDHIDGNCLNNTRGNLRILTHQQNNQNRNNVPKSNTGILGVYRKNNGKYMSDIGDRTIGTYNTLDEAIIARCNAVIEANANGAMYPIPKDYKVLDVLKKNNIDCNVAMWYTEDHYKNNKTRGDV